MAFLSQRMMTEVSRSFREAHGIAPFFFDVNGRLIAGTDPIDALASARRQRNYALQESLSMGNPFLSEPVPGLLCGVLALEDRRMILGGSGIGPVRMEDAEEAPLLSALIDRRVPRRAAANLVAGAPVWSRARGMESARALQETFYMVSGWKPVLMQENRIQAQRQHQIAEAIEDMRRSGRPALYAFEKERTLLAHIRAGDRPAAKQILNDMLAAIYLSSPQLPVLRARSIEMVSCLTRAAIEDNTLLESLIDRNHEWTERLLRARSFEDLSRVLMDALDSFIDAIALHGMNRSNPKVRAALEYVAANHAKPISLRVVAAHVGLSPCRLAHLVKACTGLTLTQVLHQVRIRQAQHLLERTAKSCTDIAYEVGFGDQSYFTKLFRRHTGATPRRHRQFRA